MLTLTALVTFISCPQAATKQGSPKKSLTKTEICPDEKVKEIMGDSIANVIFSPKVTVVAYKMSPSETPGDNDHTIGGIKVAKEVGKIDRSYFPIMQFLLSDSLTFKGEIIVPARPFVAIMALEFKQKKESVFLLFSFGSREISAVRNGKEIWRKHIGNPRRFLLFFSNIIKKDKDLEFYLK